MSFDTCIINNKGYRTVWTDPCEYRKLTEGLNPSEENLTDGLDPLTEYFKEGLHPSLMNELNPHSDNLMNGLNLTEEINPK